MDIDKIYKEDPNRYRHLALQSEYMQLPQFNEMSLTQKLYFIKALGIILGRCHFDTEAQSIEFDEAIISIAKKRWKKIYRYVYNSSQFIAMSEIDRLIPYEGSQHESQEMYTRFCMTMFFCYYFFKQVNTNDEVTKYYAMLYSQYGTKNLSQQFEMSQYDEAFRSAVQKYIKFAEKFLSFEDILEDKENKETGRMRDLSTVPFAINDLDPTSIYLENVPSKQMIQQLVIGYILITKEYEPDKEKFINYMIHVRVSQAMCQSYKKYEKYILTVQEEFDHFYLEQEESKKRVSDLTQTIRQKDDKIKSLQDQIIQLNKQLESEITKNRKLNMYIDENKYNHQELCALREFVFSIETEKECEPEEKEIYCIEEMKGIIIGGHPSFHGKLKHYVPNFKYISVEQLNFDTSIITPESCLFFITGYLSHAMYYKCIDVARECGAKVAFINQTNVELAMKEIHRCLMA